MKRLIPILIFLAVSATAQAPTKLFDVQNGNGAVISGQTANRATLIWFRDNAAKQKVMDAFSTAYGYQATVPDPNNPGQTIPNPQSQQAFFNAQLTRYIRDIVRSEAIKAAAATASTNAASTEDADLPPQN